MCNTVEILVRFLSGGLFLYSKLSKKDLKTIFKLPVGLFFAPSVSTTLMMIQSRWWRAENHIDLRNYVLSERKAC